MSAEGAGRLVILSGPSCVGKSPLAKALDRFHPDLSANLHPIVLFNSRAPRPGERDGEDYHFRSRGQIETLRNQDRYVVMDEPYCTDWLDTTDSERAFRYQRHGFDDIVRDVQALLGWRKPFTRLARPFVRRQMLALSPYFKA